MDDMPVGTLVSTTYGKLPDRPRSQSSNVDFVLMKNSNKFAFDIDLITQKQDNGKLKVYLGIEKVRRQNGKIGGDVVNRRSPDRVGLKKFENGATLDDRMTQIEKDLQMIENIEKTLQKKLKVGDKTKGKQQQHTSTIVYK